MSKFKTWWHGLADFYKGPDFKVHDPKVKEKDRNNFVIYISLVLAFVFFIFLRGNEYKTVIDGEFIETVSTGVPQAFIDIKNAAIYPFTHPFDWISALYIALPAVFIGYAITCGIIGRKKNYHTTLNAIYTAILGIMIYFFIYELVAFDCGRDNRWLIFVIMMAPFVVFMYSLGIHTYRLSIKAFAHTDETGIQEEDYSFRKERNKVWWTRFSVWFSKNWGQVLAILALLIFAFSVLLPVIILLYRSIKTVAADLEDPYAVSQTVQFENFRYAWDILRTGFLNSAITTVCVTLGVVILASILAYGFIRFSFPGKKFLYFFIIALMMIPGILTLLSRYQLVQQLGMSSTLTGIIVPGIAGYIPASFMLIFTFFAGLPKDLFEAADIDGASDFSIYWNVVVPLSKPILTTIAIQTFVGEWNDYLWAKLIIGTNENLYTLPVLMTSTFTDEFVSFYGPYAFAGYIMSALPLVLVFIVASKQFIEGLTSGAFKM